MSEKIIEIWAIKDICYETFPCQHLCLVLLDNGKLSKRLLDGDTIVNIPWRMSPKKFKLNETHFGQYIID